MSKLELLSNNLFLIIFTNLAFFSFFAVEVYGINYTYETPASKILLVDKPYDITLKVKDHKGLNSLEHVQIKMKIDDHHDTTSISIKWSQLDGNQLVTIDDNELVKDVTVIASSRGFLEFQFEFTPIQEIVLRSMSVDVLEQKPNDIKKSAEPPHTNDSELVSIDSESVDIKVQNHEKESTQLKSKKDKTTQHGIERNTSLFDSYREGQQLIAEETFRMLVGNKNIQNQHFGKNFNEPNTIMHLSRAEDSELTNTILKEMQRAEEFFDKHFHVHYNFID